MCASESWLGKEDLEFLYVFSTGLIPRTRRCSRPIFRTRFVVVQTPYLVHPW